MERMEKVILTRYGEYSDGILNEQGLITMLKVAKKISLFLEDKNIVLIAADVRRAIDSAKVLAEVLKIEDVKISKKLYAAEEEGHFPNIEKAMGVINDFRERYDVLIIIASKEYISWLPARLLGDEVHRKINLSRGDIIVIDLFQRTLEVV